MQQTGTAPRDARDARRLSRDRGTAVAVIVAATLVSLPGAFWGLPFGKFIVGALVILDGGVPYRDFWTMYAPGPFYLTAALFALFGTELIVQGVASVLLRAAAAGTFFLLARRIGAPRRAALLLTALFIGMLWHTAPELDTYFPVLLLLLLALERMLSYLESGRRGPLFQAGLLCGFGAWFKHDVAAYGAAAFIGSLFLTWLAAAARRPAVWFRPLAASACLATGAILPVLPVALFLAWKAGADAWQDLIVFPSTLFAKVFAEPYPPPYPNFFGALAEWLQDPSRLTRGRGAVGRMSSWILCNLPQWVFVAGVATVIHKRGRLTVPALSAAILLLCLLPFFWAAAHVQQNTHVYSMAASSMLLGAMAWPAVARGGRTARVGVLAFAALYAAGLMLPPAMDLLIAARRFPSGRPLGIPGTWGVRVPGEEYEVHGPIARFVREHVPPDEPIYVGVKRHDAIVITDMRFYYLTARRGVSPYYELHPGIADDGQTQADLIRAIEDRGVRCVVLWRFGWKEEVLDAIKARRAARVAGLGSTALDEFLASAFEPVAEYGQYELLWRRGARGATASAGLARPTPAGGSSP